MGGREIRIMKTYWEIWKDKRKGRDRLTGETGKYSCTMCIILILRDMFVDKNRGISVVMGEKDNKQAMEKRRKNLIKERLKYGKAGIEEEVELKWDHYYTKVDILRNCVYANIYF